MCVEPEGRKQAADPVPRGCSAQKSWRAASGLAQVTRTHLPEDGVGDFSNQTESEPLRTYEQVCDVGLFLFNDVLVLTRRTVHHRPFTLARRSTHTFLSSAPVRSLAAREIAHTRCESAPTPTSSPHGRTSTTFVSLCRCEPRLRPGRPRPVVGLCHGARTGEGLLPVCADVHHSLSSRLTPGQGGQSSNRTGRLGATVRAPRKSHDLQTFDTLV